MYASGQSSRAVNSVPQASEVRIHPTSTNYASIAQREERLVEAQKIQVRFLMDAPFHSESCYRSLEATQVVALGC